MTGLKVGLLVNPVAGIGGAVALKGSDGADIQAQAAARGGVPRAPPRTRRVLAALADQVHAVRWFTWAAAMGADYLAEFGVDCQILGTPSQPSSRADTRKAAAALAGAGIDILLFAGGDGTARDVFDGIADQVPVLGIPAGVKMHSGVFATTPEQAGQLLSRLISGGLVSAVQRDVRDLDESALQDGQIRPRYFGELRVPEAGGYLQHTKERGRENEALALQEIAAELVARLATITEPVVLGPGGTLAEIKRALGISGSILGFDVWQAGEWLARDVDADWLLENLPSAWVVLSFTRGQGFLIGRGNQQLTPEFLRRIGLENLIVVGTRTKLASLEGRPLLMDSDDAALDLEWAGLIEITTGFEDRLFYRLDSHA